MNSYQRIKNGQATLRNTVLVAALSFTVFGRFAALAAHQVALWDTLSPLEPNLAAQAQESWKLVPSDLLALETDPPKASSDPGYYGREYVFKGDAIVENPFLVIVFGPRRAGITLYAKDLLHLLNAAPQPTPWPGKKIAELAPLDSNGLQTTISRLELLRNAADEIALRVFFNNSADLIIVLGSSDLLEIKPGDKMSRMQLVSSVEYGVAPAFIGDDLIFSPADYSSTNGIWIPAENFFVSLMEGKGSELVMTWPKGNQKLKLQAGQDQEGKRFFESVVFEPDGQSLFLSALAAPGLWHKESLNSSFLEKDLSIQWRRPFPAKWKTQLYEEGVKTSFAFRQSKGQIWRGVPGSYNYPAWFSGDAAFFHLSKKVPPKGEALVYFLEGQDTPLPVTTPVDAVKNALGRPMADAILDLAGRKLRTHHRRGGEGVRRACTCGCTEAIQAVFEAREEVAKKDYIEGALGDMIYFVHRHVERIDEYQRFADELLKFLEANIRLSPELKSYLDDLGQIARQIPQQYEVQKENMKSFAYADDLVRQTLALSDKKESNNLKAYMDLLKAWRDMGGAQDYVLAQCHTITRSLCQAAGYGGVGSPAAAALAQVIRARCKQCLRNPDGYEIWADY